MCSFCPTTPRRTKRVKTSSTPLGYEGRQGRANRNHSAPAEHSEGANVIIVDMQRHGVVRVRSPASVIEAKTPPATSWI
jgi:hypothetical protein